jgi:hypothetical protein
VIKNAIGSYSAALFTAAGTAAAGLLLKFRNGGVRHHAQRDIMREREKTNEPKRAMEHTRPPESLFITLTGRETRRAGGDRGGGGAFEMAVNQPADPMVDEGLTRGAIQPDDPHCPAAAAPEESVRFT